MMNLNITMSINILIVGGLNIQSQRLLDWKKKSQTFCVHDAHFKYKDINILKEWKIYIM